MEEFLCKKCYEKKPLTEFPNKKGGRGGKSWSCKVCTREYYKNYKIKVKVDSDEKLKKYFGYKLSMIRRQDRNKFPEHENELSIDDLLEIYKRCKGRCVYSNKKLKCGSAASIYAKISFDRIDNDIPHTKENLQLTSVFMNMTRGEMTDQEFRNYINEH